MGESTNGRRTVIKLRDRPTLIKETAEWFASKWHLPVAVYEEEYPSKHEKKHIGSAMVCGVE